MRGNLLSHSSQPLQSPSAFSWFPSCCHFLSHSWSVHTSSCSQTGSRPRVHSCARSCLASRSSMNTQTMIPITDIAATTVFAYWNARTKQSHILLVWLVLAIVLTITYPCTIYAFSIATFHIPRWFSPMHGYSMRWWGRLRGQVRRMECGNVEMWKMHRHLNCDLTVYDMEGCLTGMHIFQSF